jgi:mannitol-1-phosphate/altronate dehydrogenase
MNTSKNQSGIDAGAITATSYDRAACQVGMVHLGFGAFHRAHQAVYLDDYMQQSGDLRWGIAAVNLRGSEAGAFSTAASDIDRHDGYYLKTYSPDGAVSLRQVRSHVMFSDWSVDKKACESLLSMPTVQLVTITVTESGYYTDANGQLNTQDPTIRAEIAGESSESVYAYLLEALAGRMAATGAPLTIACCDNIRQNGKMLQRNLLSYLAARKQNDLADWVQQNVAFPCSMVDRITPRSPQELSVELTALISQPVESPIMAEDFTQWVLESRAAADMPDLGKVGVTVTADVDPYEETKIRVLNGGHTALAYLAALEGVETFDEAMRVPHLLEHFQNFEQQEVLPALTLELPFSKENYLQQIAERFGNSAIGDTVARICADGMAKFAIFIRPTLEGCLQQDIMPVYAIRSIASWYVFALHVDKGNIGFEYNEPGWSELKAMLGTDEFLTNKQLWGELPVRYPEFSNTLQREIADMESKWPV